MAEMHTVEIAERQAAVAMRCGDLEGRHWAWGEFEFQGCGGRMERGYCKSRCAASVGELLFLGSDSGELILLLVSISESRRGTDDGFFE
jgi:hypothetical protein